MDDLDATLRAAIEARQELARAATAGPWVVARGDPEFLVVHHDDEIASSASGVVMLVGAARFANSMFIAAESPDVVITNCTEDLDVLSRHTGEIDPGICFWCSEDLAGEDMIIVEWPCPEVRSLARRYGIEIPA